MKIQKYWTMSKKLGAALSLGKKAEISFECGGKGSRDEAK
jgi:hypothetical protein